jgi:3',5'-cyclic-AMP phosphodiesterase
LRATYLLAEERARFDEKVGRAQSADASVVVADGLATIRRLEAGQGATPAGQLEFWAQAPAVTMSLTSGATRAWVVRARNVMDGGMLRGVGADGELEVRLLERPIPTESLWQVTTPPGDVTLRFVPPDFAVDGTWRFAVYADVQRCIDHVQDLYDGINDERGVRFALISGDLTPNGSPESLDRFQRELRSLRVPAYATLGNHELGSGQLNFHRRYGRGSFSFAHRGARFTLVDSASATLAPKVDGWLDGWLDDAEDGLHLFITHIPPLDPSGARNGGFASRAEGHRLVAKLARHGVDLTIYGHVHTYHEFENAGIEALISGGGGAIPQRLDNVGRHYLVVDVDSDAQTFETRMVRVFPEFL